MKKQEPPVSVAWPDAVESSLAESVIGKPETRKFVNDVIALCNQAGKPALASRLVAECDTLDEVRGRLIAILAKESPRQAAKPAPVKPSVKNQATLRAEDVKLVGNGNSPIVGAFNASSPDGSLLAYAIVTKPQHGKVEIGDGSSFTLTPETDYTGSDEFEYLAATADGNSSNVAKVEITVLAPAEQSDPQIFPANRGKLTAVEFAEAQAAQDRALRVMRDLAIDERFASRMMHDSSLNLCGIVY